MIYLPKQVCLTIIHRDTTYILDMSCCYKHQQQKKSYLHTLYACWYIGTCYHKNNVLWQGVTLWSIHVCRVWKVAISLSNPNFSQIEHVTKQHQTLKTWIGYNATRYLNFHPLRHVLPYIFSQFNLNRP